MRDWGGGRTRNRPASTFSSLSYSLVDKAEVSVAVLQTTTCHSYGHPEFRITYDPGIVPVDDDVRWLAGWLEESVAQGKRFAARQTCQVGWVVTDVRLGEDGVLSLWEPDMRVLPVTWKQSVSTTIARLRLQKDVVESVLPPDDLSFPSMRQSAIICSRFGENNGLVMERRQPSETDSGWFCGCSGGDHDHNSVAELRRVSLYEAVIRCGSQIVPYLALPAGVLVAVSGKAPAIFVDNKPLRFKHGSFLAVHYPSP